MAVLPQGGLLQNEIETEEMSSRTYRLDLKNKRITGHTDGLDAIKQAAYKILHTDRFEHLIYSWSYGFEGDGLIGQDRLFVQSELKRRIREALLQDDRISDVSDVQISFEGDWALVQFTAISDYGSFNLEVSANV